MAKHAKKTGRSTGPVVTPLEHHVPVEWYVVGTKTWFEEAWEPDALEDYQKIVVARPSELKPVIAELQAMRNLGVDTETSGPYKAGDKAYSMNPANPDTRVVLLQIGNLDKVFLIEPRLIPHFKELLESDKVLHIGHNLIYDFKWLLVKYKIHLQRMYCSMLAEQMLTAGLMGMKVTLSDSVRRRAPYWIINKAVRDLFTHMDHVNGCPDCLGGRNKKLTREMGYYAARDIVLLFPLMNEQINGGLDENGKRIPEVPDSQCGIRHWQLQRAAQVEFDIIPATAEMEIEGVDLHRGIMNQIIEYWTQRERELAEEFFTIYNEELKKNGNMPEGLLPGADQVFNLKSNAAKLEALRELDIDLDNIKRDTLKEASKEKDLTEAQRRLLLISAEISNVFKMTTTYGKNMVDKISPNDNRWHPRFKQLGSGEEEGRKSGSEDKSTIATGRFSSDAQQFPKPKELFATVKNPKEAEHVMAHFAEQIAAAKAQAQAASA